jgi:soluble lytic murein transglycosylase
MLEYQSAFTLSQDANIQSAALLGAARTQLSSGQYQQAADTLLSLIQHYPQSPLLPYGHFYLGRANDALGRYQEAADEYLNYMALRSGVVDAYVLKQRGDSLWAAGDYPGAINDYRAALQSPSLMNSLALEVDIARAHAAVGDYQTALGIYQDIYNRTDDDYTKAQMDYLLGQAYTALGQMEQAYAAYQDAVNNYPTSYDSYLALLILVEAGVPVDELNRGIVDYYAGEYGVALAAIDRYFQTNGSDVSTARYYNGLALRALGGYADAVNQWDIVIQNYPEDRFWDDAWEQKAFTQWYYMNDYDRGIQTLIDFVSAAPANPRAGEFLFDAAEVAEQAGYLDQAAAIWERVASEYPEYEEAQRALFLAGITHYRLGAHQNALSLFQRALGSAFSLQDRAAALFWQSKALSAMGDPNAQLSWEQAASVDPTGYYSERARDILLQRAPFSPPNDYDIAVDWEGERRQAEEWLRATFSIPAEEDLSSPGPLYSYDMFTRGSELWQLGMLDEARIEFEELRNLLQSDPANSYRLTNYLLDLGLYRSAILSARQILDLAGMSDADTMSAPAFFNHVRFGTYFSELIFPVAEEYGFDPLFLFSVVRQESAFEGFVRSSAGARGLMQIIPTTGQEVSSALSWPEDYTDEDLYRPFVSVRLGSEYLAKWRDHFNNDLYAALAAYNGGPGNAIAWQGLSNSDPDLFLEVVGFDETRNYLRGISEIYGIYRRIYSRTP